MPAPIQYNQPERDALTLSIAPGERPFSIIMEEVVTPSNNSAEDDKTCGVQEDLNPRIRQEEAKQSDPFESQEQTRNDPKWSGSCN